mgnify:CR=1 FL=1
MSKNEEIKRIESLIAAGVSKHHECSLRYDLSRINEVDDSIKTNPELKKLESEYIDCQDERLKRLLLIEIKELKEDILSKKKEQLELDIAVAISKLMLDFQKENNVKIEYLNLYFDEQSGKSFVGSVNIEL